jgi:hypothetical protein
MVPNAYHAYFAGCASVAGTLIGLLFVAMSVSPHKDVGRRAPLSFQVQAAVAFTTLINTLVVALVALLPGNSLGAAGVLLACAGISSAIGMAVLSLRDWPGRRHLAGILIIPVLGVLYIVQLLNGINLSLNPSNASAVHLQALLVIVFFLIAIARAWRMIGARNTRVTAMISDLLRERNTTPVVADAVEHAKADVAATRPAAVSGSAGLDVFAADATPRGASRQEV